jgi:hypothetical protein
MLAIAAAFSFVKRDTDGVLKAQHEQELQAELQSLADFKSWLSVQQSAPDATIARIFLSKGVIASLLAPLGNITVPMPNAGDTNLTINEIKANFRPGFPGLSISASVERSGVRADVSTLARIEPQIEGNVLKLRVHVDNLVPRVTWRFIDFKVGGLVRELAQTTLADAINKKDALGSITIPLSQAAAFSTPATQVPFSVTGMNGIISIPAYSEKVSAKITRIIAMPEGLYIYASIQRGEG